MNSDTNYVSGIIGKRHPLFLSGRLCSLVKSLCSLPTLVWVTTMLFCKMDKWLLECQFLNLQNKLITVILQSCRKHYVIGFIANLLIANVPHFHPVSMSSASSFFPKKCLVWLLSGKVGDSRACHLSIVLSKWLHNSQTCC